MLPPVLATVCSNAAVFLVASDEHCARIRLGLICRCCLVYGWPSMMTASRFYNETTTLQGTGMLRP